MGDLRRGSPAPQTEESVSPILAPATLLALDPLEDALPLTVVVLVLLLSVLKSLSICGGIGDVAIGVTGLLTTRSVTNS